MTSTSAPWRRVTPLPLPSPVRKYRWNNISGKLNDTRRRKLHYSWISTVGKMIKVFDLTAA
jgi:hypothetical protein